MVTPGQMQMFNKPEPYEAQILGSQYKMQYEWVPSSDLPSAGVYKIRLHDHTLGNALRMQLLRDSRVLFAGYRVPHPLFPEIELRIQTVVQWSPPQSLATANTCLRQSAKSMMTKFDDELAKLDSNFDRINPDAAYVYPGAFDTSQTGPTGEITSAQLQTTESSRVALHDIKMPDADDQYVIE